MNLRPLPGILLFLCLGGCQVASPRAPLVTTVADTTVEFRGLSAAEPSAIWAGGRNGTYARSDDGGATWQSGVVPGAAELFFIDAHAVDETTAYLLGTHFEGGLAQIYKTTDGGKRWTLQFSDDRPDVFFDGMAFWDAERGLAFSDPVAGSFLIVVTRDGGAHWEPVPPENLPPPLPGEAGFAASGTAITVAGTRHAWFGTGGGEVARVYRSEDGGRSWSVAETGLPAGPTAGIFGVAFRDSLNGVAVGGDYTERRAPARNVARTRDGGRTWTPVGSSQPAGVRYGAIYATQPEPTPLIAVGPSGLGFSLDDGVSWTPVDTLDLNTVAFSGEGAVWAAGVAGRIARFWLPDR